MHVIACLISVAVLYCVSSYASYNKTIRDSNYVFLLNCAIGVMSSSIWIIMIRALNDTNKIIAASLAWDLIVTAAYVIVPMLMQGKAFSWQAYAALAAAIAAIMWFKTSTSG